MKNIIIFGGTSGIGLEVAKKFKNENVIVVGRNDSKIKKIDNVSFYYADLKNIESLSNACKKIAKKVKSIDMIVNSAGVFQLKPISEITIRDYQEIFDVNVRAPIFITKFFLEKLKNNNYPSYIFNIGSSSCYNGGKLTSLYCASKHALLGFSRSINDELKSYNIRVCNLSPSSTKTKMGKIPLASNQKYETFIEPKEVADVLYFISQFSGNMEIREILLNRVHVQ